MLKSPKNQGFRIFTLSGNLPTNPKLFQERTDLREIPFFDSRKPAEVDPIKRTAAFLCLQFFVCPYQPSRPVLFICLSVSAEHFPAPRHIFKAVGRKSRISVYQPLGNCILNAGGISKLHEIPCGAHPCIPNRNLGKI